MDLASALIAGVPAVLVGVLGDRLSLRRKRDSDRIERSRNAADEVLATLRTLRDLVRDSEWNELHPRKWSEACGSFDQAWENNDHRFPDKWRHLHRSVRSAIGTHVGGVVTARDDNRMVDYPVAPFDRKWFSLLPYWPRAEPGAQARTRPTSRPGRWRQVHQRPRAVPWRRFGDICV